MTGPMVADIEPRERNRIIAAATARALLTTAVLVALYYLVPVRETWRLSSGLRLAVALALFAAVLLWQVRIILNSKHPGVRAIEALAVIVPLFLLLFYFAVTIFSTVGFGDITATSETGRVVVSLQMVLDLIILGVGINALLHAAKVGRQRQSPTTEAEPT